MNLRKFFASLVNIAILCACGYILWNWKGTGGENEESPTFVESACITGADSKFHVSNTHAYETRENANGYVVRMTTTLPRGGSAKVTCLANERGRVTSITINEH